MGNYDATITIGLTVDDPQALVEAVNSILGNATQAAKNAGAGIAATLTETADHAGKGAAEKIESHFHEMLEESKETFGEMGKVMGGVLLGGGIMKGLDGVGEGLEQLWEGGEKNREMLEGLQQGFAAAGLQGEKLEHAVQGSVKAAGDANEKYGLDIDRMKELASTAALVGGATGKTNNDVTLFAAGVEKMSKGVINGDMIIRTFTRGLNDPEAQANIGRLKMQFPQLAVALKGITDPAQMTQAALKALSGGFDELQKGAGEGVGEVKKVQSQIMNFVGEAGGHIVDFVGGALKYLIDGAKETWAVVGPFFTGLYTIIKESVIVSFKLLWGEITTVWSIFREGYAL